MQKTRPQRFICIDILLTLLALAVMGFFYYGIRSAVLCGVCAVSAAAAEAVSLRLTKRRLTLDNIDCVTDAVLLALMLPSVADLGTAAFACVLANIIARNVFGGSRNMLFSPAAVGYIFILTSWRKDALLFTEPHVHTEIFGKAGELASSASHVLNTTGRMEYSAFDLLMGNVCGAIGAVSILLLAVSAVILLFRRDISAGAFIGTLTGTAVPALIAPVCADPVRSLGYTLSTNMVLFAAIYIVSDRRIAPRRNYYAFFYGFFIGVAAYILVLTAAKENAVVMVAVIFTPAALAFRNLESRIDAMKEAENASAPLGEEAVRNE